VDEQGMGSPWEGLGGHQRVVICLVIFCRIQLQLPPFSSSAFNQKDSIFTESECAYQKEWSCDLNGKRYCLFQSGMLTSAF